MRYFEQAAVFTESCLEYGLIKLNQDTSILSSPSLLPMLAMLSTTTNKKGGQICCNKAICFSYFCLFFCIFVLLCFFCLVFWVLSFFSFGVLSFFLVVFAFFVVTNFFVYR